MTNSMIVLTWAELRGGDMPFERIQGSGLPVPVLAQTDREEFEICVPFKYRWPDGSEVIVPKNDDFRRTDLASVPAALLWLVPRYGAHTLAALLHDQLVDDPEVPNRVDADTTFRNALGELQVPLLRRWMMWAAVSVLTTWKDGALGKLRVSVWGTLTVLASFTLWQHVLAAIVNVQPWSWFVFGKGMASDLVIIAVASVALTPRIGLGLIAGASLVFVFVPTIAVSVVTLAYIVLDTLARGAIFAYNALIAPRFRLKPLANVHVVMSRSDDVPVTPGCRELL